MKTKMKKIFYCLLVIPFFLASCDGGEEEQKGENIGIVDGIWELTTITPYIEHSNPLISAGLTTALQLYAKEPAAYRFDDENKVFEQFDYDEAGEVVSTGEGTYLLDESFLTLTFTGMQVVGYEVFTLDQTTLKIKKEYLNELAAFGLEILGDLVHTSPPTKAYTIATYTKYVE
jgi:hypothetical protein